MYYCIFFIVADNILSCTDVSNEGSMLLEAVDGFSIVIETGYRIMFVSEQIKQHLGIAQVGLCICYGVVYLLYFRLEKKNIF